MSSDDDFEERLKQSDLEETERNFVDEVKTSIKTKSGKKEIVRNKIGDLFLKNKDDEEEEDDEDEDDSDYRPTNFNAFGLIVPLVTMLLIIGVGMIMFSTLQASYVEDTISTTGGEITGIIEAFENLSGVFPIMVVVLPMLAIIILVLLVIRRAF